MALHPGKRSPQPTTPEGTQLREGCFLRRVMGWGVASQVSLEPLLTGLPLSSWRMWKPKRNLPAVRGVGAGGLKVLCQEGHCRFRQRTAGRAARQGLGPRSLLPLGAKHGKGPWTGQRGLLGHPGGAGGG